ncbi:MAG: iron ABC transporter permease [Deltaproteobacteria bacterium]|nr:iron ABC transporter permease [Deltaproteobacteria bacterium]
MMTSTTPLTEKKRRKWLVIGFCALTTSFAFSAFISPDGWSSPASFSDVLFQLRLRRVGMGVLAGMGLAGSGVVLQALLRNPLADPFIIGVSGGAALGGTFVLVLFSGAPLLFLVAGAGTGALITTLMLATFLVRSRRGGDPALLAGVVLNAFAASLITLAKTLLPATKAQALLFWLVGRIGYPSTTNLLITAGLILTPLLISVSRAGRLELMAFGDDEAYRLGIDVRRERLFFFFAASLMVGVLIPQCGLIGFVGLVLPHALRRLVDADHRLLLPLSALFGGAVVVLFDAASRGLFFILQTELPVGALTALIGAPLFGWSLVVEMRGNDLKDAAKN